MVEKKSHEYKAEKLDKIRYPYNIVCNSFLFVSQIAVGKGLVNHQKSLDDNCSFKSEFFIFNIVFIISFIYVS